MSNFGEGLALIVLAPLIALLVLITLLASGVLLIYKSIEETIND